MAFSADDAKFSINGDPSVDGAGDRGYDAATSEQLDLTLETAPSPAISVRYQVFDPAAPQSPKASAGAPLLTFLGSGTAAELLSDPNGTASVVMPGAVLNAYRIRATISTPEGDFFFERLVVIRGTSGIRKSVPAESIEYEARSFSDMLNEYADVIEGGPASGQANTASNLGAGAGVFKAKVGVDLQFRSIVGIGSIGAAVDSGAGDTIEVDGTALLPRDGTRQVTGTIDFDGNNIDNVVTIIGEGTDGPTLRTVGSDQTPAVVHESTGTNGASGGVLIGDRDPNGNVPGNPGDLYRRITDATSALYIHVGAVPSNSDWTDVSIGLGGDVVGPGVTDDEAVARFDGVTGKLLQNSAIKVSDAGEFRDWALNRIEPAALAAGQNDYAPAGWADSDVLHQLVNGAQEITGFAAVVAGAGVLRKWVFCEDTDGDDEFIRLRHQDAGSVATNRIICPFGQDVVLGPGEGTFIYYDTVDARWRVAGWSEEHRTHFNTMADTGASTEDDYDGGLPDKWRVADFLLLQGPEGGVEFTGFAAADLVQFKKILIADDNEGVTIRHDDAGSAAANRVLCPRGVDIVLNQNEAVLLWYDETNSRWRAALLQDTEQICVIAPSAIAAQQNDYTPTSWEVADFLKLTLTGNQTITGFGALSARQRKVIYNDDPTDTLTLAHENVASLAANRIKTQIGGNIAIPPKHAAILDYDLLAARWTVVSFMLNEFDLINDGASTGVVSGGILSAGAGADEFSISDGFGFVVDNTTTPATPLRAKVTWSGLADITVTDIGTQLITFVSIDGAGAVIQRGTKWTRQMQRDEILLGVVVHVDLATVNAFDHAAAPAINMAAQLGDLYEGLGLLNVGGNLYSPRGGVGTELELNKSIGVMMGRGVAWDDSPKNPSHKTVPADVGLTFQYRFQTGINGATGTDIDPDIYDVGGVSTPVPVNKFTIQRAYIFVAGNTIIQPGQAVYNSLADAIAAIQTEAFVTEASIMANGLLRAFIVVGEGASDLTAPAEAFFLNAGKFGETAGAGGLSTTTMQGAYDNSTPDPEILTSDAGGAVQFRRGTTGDDSDSVFEVENDAGDPTFAVSGEGEVTGLAGPKVVQARRTGVYALTTAWADIAFDATDVETDALVLDHDLAVNTDNIIAVVGGVYEITYSAHGAMGAGNAVEARVRINDTTVIPGSLTPYGGDTHNATHNYGLTRTFFVVLAAGDFITLQLQANPAVAASTVATNTLFTARRVGGAP